MSKFLNMSKNNGYLQRKAQRELVVKEATRQTFVQYMVDTLILTVADKNIMGKDTFGEKRIKKLVEAWGKNYDKWFEALTKNAEADYFRYKMDEEIKRVSGDDFHPFEQRYEWLSKITYDKK